MCSFGKAKGPDGKYYYSSYRVVLPRSPTRAAPAQMERSLDADVNSFSQVTIATEPQNSSVPSDRPAPERAEHNHPRAPASDDGDKALSTMFKMSLNLFDDDAWSPTHPKHSILVRVINDLNQRLNESLQSYPRCEAQLSDALTRLEQRNMEYLNAVREQKTAAEVPAKVARAREEAQKKKRRRVAQRLLMQRLARQQKAKPQGMRATAEEAHPSSRTTPPGLAKEGKPIMRDLPDMRMRKTASEEIPTPAAGTSRQTVASPPRRFRTPANQPTQTRQNAVQAATTSIPSAEQSWDQIAAPSGAASRESGDDSSAQSRDALNRNSSSIGNERMREWAAARQVDSRAEGQAAVSSASYQPHEADDEGAEFVAALDRQYRHKNDADRELMLMRNERDLVIAPDSGLARYPCVRKWLMLRRAERSQMQWGQIVLPFAAREQEKQDEVMAEHEGAEEAPQDQPGDELECQSDH
ncbi:hypothetical protein N0V93_008885 [Gnomoniopsis smithogilvyi]|uniref:Uncharacterized protein n=1 Tax=Gnomoniopsis smithogilvyi TaxID=1191159 RepID=A0A9W9CT94_9PEZI|nr:hypothetical protein N0V93_008885 [Gnomoniopsis smithogilvyi]